MAELKHYAGREPLIVTPETIFHIVKAIITSKQEAQFLREVEKFKESIEVQPDLVNFIKDYLHKNTDSDADPRIASVVGSPPGTISCFPRRPIR